MMGVTVQGRFIMLRWIVGGLIMLRWIVRVWNVWRLMVGRCPDERGGREGGGGGGIGGW